jgi:flagellar motility protein MotE (MotC chaperone)
MNIRRLVASSTIVVLAVVGGAGIAGAQTQPSSPTASTTTKDKHCDRALARIPKLQDRVQKLEQELDKIRARIADAQAKHDDELVKRLEARLDRVQKAHDKVVDIINKIHERCGP